MKALLIAFISGVIFSIGLVVSGMTNPSKVIGFLDVFGKWDYSLVFVMVGAISVSFVTFRYLSNKKPICGDNIFLPQNTKVDKKLLIGSAMFGIGWGVAGICPGPGIVNLVTNEVAIYVFMGSLIFGMLIYKQTEKFWD